MKQYSVLYVEDEEDYQSLVQQILGKAGMTVHIAASGEAGWRALEQVKPNLVILDVNLPDTDGYAICRELRRRPGTLFLPVLLLTVRRRPEEWLKGFSAGADDYLTKPLNPPELVERVLSTLKARPPAVRPSPDTETGAEYLLIQAAAAGNRMAFEVLIQKYKQRLLNSLHAAGKSEADAQDIVSITFIKAYEQLNRFRGTSSFYTWLYRIAFNGRTYGYFRNHLSLDQMSARNKNVRGKFSASDRVSDDIAVDSLKTHVHQAVARVPRPYGQVLKLHFLQGVSCHKIARRLRIPRGTVMSRLFTARALFRKTWRAHSKE